MDVIHSNNENMEVIALSRFCHKPFAVIPVNENTDNLIQEALEKEFSEYLPLTWEHDVNEIDIRYTDEDWCGEEDEIATETINATKLTILL